MLVLLLYIFLSFGICFEDKFSARGIFVTVEYKGEVVKGTILYSFKFLNISDLIEIYSIPFYLIKDITHLNLEKSFKLKFYGHNFYLFRYIASFTKHKNNNLVSNQVNYNSYEETDFFDYYFKNIDKNFSFYLFDMTFQSLSKEYSYIPKHARKNFINDLGILFNNSLFNINKLLK
ncbi:MAG: hypothetical protein N2Z20_05905 [Elusimicrobiales bacterium]|nr:hypothetical protein [Elusimicrobiales bacterium]